MKRKKEVKADVSFKATSKRINSFIEKNFKLIIIILLAYMCLFMTVVTGFVAMKALSLIYDVQEKVNPDRIINAYRRLDEINAFDSIINIIPLFEEYLINQTQVNQTSIS